MSDNHTIDTLDALLDLYDAPGETSLLKESNALTPEYRQWIEVAPLFTIASTGPGGLDCSPRGDKRGQLVNVLSATCLAVPDRRGNNRLDTLRNIVSNPQIALLFFIPGINETLRINGVASLTTDPVFLNRFTVKETKPVSVILIEIETVYFQCGRALIRSGFWNPDLFEHRGNIPTAGQMSKGVHADFNADTYDKELPYRQLKTLY